MKESSRLVDKQLETMASVNATLGKDSTAEEKAKVKRICKLCVEIIKELDADIYELIEIDETEEDESIDKKA